MRSASAAPPNGPPLLSLIVQYYKHPEQLNAIARRVKGHPRVELIIHADSNTTEDAAAFAKVLAGAAARAGRG